MDTSSEPAPTATNPPRRFDWLHVLLFLLVAIFLTAGATFWILQTYVFPSEFRPVSLGVGEERSLQAKLRRLEALEPASRERRSASTGSAGDGGRVLEPEAYSEVGADREVTLSERELNALLARNTDLAHKLAIDLSADLISARLLLPLDPDFPILGGKTLKVRAGLKVGYQAGSPIVALEGISLMGVPLPNAWMGGLKHIDLVQAYGAERGFWQAFAEGVEELRVEDGRLLIRLKE